MAAWVTKVQQAWHSLQVVFQPGEVLKERINILQGADRYDRIRPIWKLLPSHRLLPTWRSAGDCTIAKSVGRRRRLAGHPTLLAKTMFSQRVLILGASGSRIYNSRRTRPSCGVGDILKESQFYHNVQASIVIGAAPPDLTQELRNFRHDLEHELTYRPGPGRNPANRVKGIKEHFLFGSVTVIIIDDHNGLCDSGSKYMGLNPNDAVTDKERAKRTNTCTRVL